MDFTGEQRSQGRVNHSGRLVQTKMAILREVIMLCCSYVDNSNKLLGKEISV